MDGGSMVAVQQGSNNQSDALKRDKESTETADAAGKGMGNIQACVIKNNLHASPIRVRVRPLTGEIYTTPPTSIHTVFNPEQDSAPVTEP